MALIFGLPPISIFVFIFAGLLLGHLLWYRDTSALENRIGELEEDLAVAEGDSSNQNDEVQSLNEALNAANGQLLRTQDELSELHGHYSKLEAIADLSGDDLSTAIELQEARSELEIIQKEHEMLRSELERVRDETSNETGVAAIDDQELSEASRQQAEMIESLTLTNAGLADQIAELEEQLLTLESERREVAASKDVSEEGERESDAEIRSLTEQLEQREDEIKAAHEASAALEQLREDYEEVDRQREETSQKYASIVTSIETMQQQLAGALDQAERTADHNERLADLIEEKSVRIDQLDQELQSARQQLKDADQQVADHSGLREELQSLSGRLDGSSRALEDRDRLIETQRTELHSVQGQLTELKRSRELHQQSEADLQLVLTRLSDVRGELAERESEKVELQSLDRYRAMHLESQTDLDLMLGRVQLIRGEMIQLSNQQAQSGEKQNRELDGLQQQLNTLDAACAAALQEAQLERAIRIDLEGKLSEKTTRIADLSRRCESISPLEIKSRELARRVEEGIDEVQRLTSELDDSREGASQLVARVGEFETLQRDNMTLAESLRANAQTMDGLHTRLRDQHSQIAVLQQRCDANESLEDQCDDLEQKLETSRITIADFVAQLEERDVQLEELGDQNARFATLHRDLESSVAKVTELERVEAGLVASLTDQDREIESLREKERLFDEMRVRLDVSEAEIRDIQQSRDELLLAAENREQTLEAIRGQLQELKAENEGLAGEAKAGEHRLIVAIKQSERMTRRLEKSEQEIEDLNGRLGSVVKLETAVSERDQNIKVLQEQGSMQTRAYSDQRQELLRLRDSLDATEITSQQLDNARDRLTETMRSHELQVAENESLRQKLKLLAEKSHSLVDALETSRQSLAEKSQQYDLIVESHSQAVEMVRRMQSGKTDSESLRADNDMLIAKVQDLVAHLRKVSVEHEESLRANEGAQQTIGKLQGEIGKQTQLIRSLQKRGSGHDPHAGEGPRKAA